MTAPLRTARLVLQPYTAADREAFVDLNTDAEVRRHLDGPLEQPQAEQLFERQLAAEWSWAVTQARARTSATCS